MNFRKTLLVAALGCLSLGVLAQDKVQNVAITAIVEHPALDAIRLGVVEELAREGFVDGKNIKIDYQSAQGSTATAAQIARKFVGDKADVIIPISTPSAQPVVAATRTIPVVFSAITDPVAAKLVKSLEASGTNVTGVTDHRPMQPQLDVLKQLLPNVQSIGYVYSAGEVNSAVVLKELQETAEAQGLKVVPVAVQRTADVGSAARSLSGKVQVIYISEDNAVVSAYEALHKASLESKIPVFASDHDTAKRGALAALSVNQYDIGVLTGKVAARVLRGESAGAIPTQEVKDLELVINQKTAEDLGIQVPEAVLKSAKEVYGK